MSALMQQALAAQAQAASPRASAFVAANAGSGKTHVLINRVIRLLMAGAERGSVQPQNILCMTYTKAAAAEMLNRLFERLGGYSVMEDEALAVALRDLDVNIPTDATHLRRARALFAQALETPGGLKIRTIHSFCESLLRRFPAEAGISPGFKVLDDRLGAVLREQAIADIGLQAFAEPEGALARAIRQLTSINANALDELYGFAAAKGRHVATLIEREGSLEAALALSARQLGIAADASEQSERQAAWQRMDMDQLKKIAAATDPGLATDKKCSGKITQSLTETKPAEAFERLCEGFLKKDFTPFAKLPTNKVKERHPWIVEAVAAVQDELMAARINIHAAAVLLATRAALVLGEAFHRRYEWAKMARGVLDFDDLVEKSVNLLSDSTAAQWVLYKLDYDLEHILVDEAQDNSERQWRLINALSAEFFAGTGTRAPMTRTLFAVGDPKQSIYSFQGAEPTMFLEAAAQYLELSKERQSNFVTPQLALSWRSCPQVLEMVDETFAPFTKKVIDGAEEIKLAGDAALYEASPPVAAPGFDAYASHQAQRQTALGCVELWEAVPRPPAAEAEDPCAPVDAQAPQSARNQLAANIAANVEGWIKRGELVHERQEGGWRQRPVGPGDIMILVNKRTGGLFDEIIRQLKLRGIAVAGADRMVLSEQTAVLDLMSAARAALQEADDLALAEFLKGPFLQDAQSAKPKIDETALYDLAAGRARGQSLWQTLSTSTDARFDEARTLMTYLREAARRTTPFDFFAGLLNHPSASGESYGCRLYARLGAEAEDPVREFLGKALTLEGEEAPSLTRFVAAQMNDETQIKRDMQGQQEAVRVMTVHGAKGLEAPVVILPDTANGPGGPGNNGPAFGEDGALFWLLSDKHEPAACQAIRAAAEQRNLQEHQRLLYVAMTRAQDRLVIGGAKIGHGEGKMDENGWYNWCQSAFDRLGERVPVVNFKTKDGAMARRFGPLPKTLVSKTGATASKGRDTLPAWAQTSLPAAPAALHRAAPSRWLDEESDTAPVLSPLRDSGARRFRRGLMIHALLQALPDMPLDVRRTAGDNYLHAQGDLDEEQMSDILDTVFGVLDAPDFAPLFGPQSRAEVPLAGLVSLGGEPYRLAGQVDRLVVDDRQVLVVDYKTNRPAPREARDISPAYLRQMAAYRALLRSLWPGRAVRCALLWTDGPRLMPLADILLDQTL